MEFHKRLLILINFLIKWVQTISEGHFDSVKSKFCISQNTLLKKLKKLWYITLICRL